MVSKVIEDEMVYRISDRASRRVFQIFAVVAASAGIILIALGSAGNETMSIIGLTLSGSVCTMLLLYIAFYKYYDRNGLEWWWE